MPKVQVTKRGNIRFVQYGTLACFVFGPNQWDDAEWDEFLNAADPSPTQEAAVASLSIHITQTWANARQRRRSAAVAEKSTIKHIAVLTDSFLVRGTITAFGWFMQHVTMKSYPRTELPTALRWLSETSAARFDAAEVEAALTEIVRELDSRV